MRRGLIAIGVLAVAAVLVVGLTQAGSGGSETGAPRFDLGAAKQSLAGAPAPLAGLHAQSSELLDGGTRAFRRRMKALRGRPVVVNKWASWCGPCRTEFPAFQQLGTQLGKRVAFVGVNAKDNRADAAGFLEEFPLPFPSYIDPDEEIARDIGAPANYPITVFYDENGRRAFIHQGGYRDADHLRADVERYLLR